MGFTPDMLAMIEAQRSHFASDEHLKERAAIWANASPEQCLAAVAEQCREAEYFFSIKSDAERERAMASEPLPADTIAILEALQRTATAR